MACSTFTCCRCGCTRLSRSSFCFFFNDTATTEIYTLSLHDALPISPAEGFCANFVTTLLVGLASVAALPASTTHVSSGAIIGIGLHRGAAFVRWTTVRDMLVAWLVTLPVAALVGAGAYVILRALTP